MSENLREQLILLPDYLRAHMVLTVAAMALGISLSVPMGIWAAQVPRVKRPLLMVVSIIQTVPSLAILALMMALLGGRIGFLPAFLALTLYSMLPIVRNTVTGLESVSDDVVEAARGIGMRPGQILVKVRLPLALPVLIAGIRTATVWTVGLATLSTLVGATSFGNYIFTGIQTRNLTSVVVGSIASAVLAVGLDALIGGLQWLAENRGQTNSPRIRRALRIAVPASLIVLLAGGVYLVSAREEADFVVAGKGFTEQYIIAGLLAGRLEAGGYNVEQRLGLGSDIPYEATKNNRVDAFLEYSGTVWANHMHREDNPGKEAVQRAVIDYMQEEDGIVTIGPAGFENLYALAMRRDRAEELGIRSIEDLIPIADTLKCGADLEFFGRPEWYRLRDTYNIDFAEKLTFDAALMYNAVNEGQVDLITAYTTDGRVAAFDLFIVADPRNALLPYDGLFVASQRAASDPEFMRIMAPLVNAIPVETMREANKIVDVDGRSVVEAVNWLEEQIEAGR